jgi:NADP-dependent 3-hydroxy acid dehydrogenase YdfG
MATIEKAFITGGASGIGLAVARALAGRGCAIFLCDINKEALQAAAQALEQAQVPVYTRALDVSDRAAVYDAVAEAERVMGGIDFLFNNAGVSLSDTVDKMTYDDLEWIMNVDFYGVVYGTKAALPGMLARGQGHIVNVSSLFGLIGVPSQSAYCAAKHAVKGFNEALHYELQGTGVEVHSVHPGGVNTNIVVNGRHNNTADRATSAEEAQKGFSRLAITTPEQAVQVIIDGVDAGQYRILVGRDARAADRFQRWLPNRWRKMFARRMANRKGRGIF